MAEKNSGISLKLFRQRAPNVFIGVLLKVHWRFSRDRRGRHLRHSIEGRRPHTPSLTVMFDSYRKSGPYFITVFPENLENGGGNLEFCL